jgi:hypothetical protein
MSRSRPRAPAMNRFLLLSVVLAAGCGKSDPPPAVVVAPPPEVAPESDTISGRAPSTEADPPAKAPPTEKSAAPAVVGGGSFKFPDDSGGKLLAKTLPPTNPPTLTDPTPTAPRPRALPAYLDAPSVPTTAAGPPVPRLPLPPGRETRPTALPDRVPTDLAPTILRLPDRGEFATAPLTKQSGPDPANPADVPILSAKPVPDRASLADPTVEFTARSVVSPTLPLRTQPAGFLRFNLPEPFEHSAAARPPVVAEDPNRALGTIPPPR